MPHYLLPGDVREEVRISIVQNSNAPPIGMPYSSVKCQLTFSLPKTWGFTRVFAGSLID